jgi:ribosomal-protein-alanine N-acetyltransferase
MPRNVRSIRVLEKAGFRDEGLAERYLLINGVWEDHRMYAITAEEKYSIEAGM